MLVPGIRVGFVALITGIVGAGAANAGEGSCPARTVPPPAPEVRSAGYAPGIGGGSLWIELANPDAFDPGVRFAVTHEWGESAAFEEAWAVPRAASRGYLSVPANATLPTAPRASATVVRVLAIAADGTAGPSSMPVRISYPALRHEESGPRPDQVLGLVLGIGLLVLCHWYLRERNLIDKIRLAGCAGLVALLGLSVTPAMTWVATSGDPGGEVPAVECLLGQEAECAAFAPDASKLPARRVADVERWRAASFSVQIGQLLSLLTLLPVFIWLVVAPTRRAAQAAVAVGGATAGYTTLALLFYRSAVPSWLGAELFWTFDLALLGAVVIVVAGVTIVRHSFAADDAAELPVARALPAGTGRRQ